MIDGAEGANPLAGIASKVMAVLSAAHMIWKYSDAARDRSYVVENGVYAELSDRVSARVVSGTAVPFLANQKKMFLALELLDVSCADTAML